MKTLGEYTAALHVEFLHSKNINSYTVPQEELIIRHRLELQSVVTTTQKWNKEIPEMDSVSSTRLTATSTWLQWLSTSQPCRRKPLIWPALG